MSGPSCGKGIAVPNAGQGVESMLETVLYLSREEKTIGGMFPTNPLQLAVILREVTRGAGMGLLYRCAQAG